MQENTAFPQIILNLPSIKDPNHSFSKFLLRKSVSQVKRLIFLKTKASWASFLVLAIFFVSNFPVLAIALTNDGQQAPQNSQNVELLQASAIIPVVSSLGTGGGDISVDSGALMPEIGPSGTIADLGNAEIYDSGDISLYVVREGDTLSGIAKMYDISANTILWANGLKKGAALTKGQTLIVLPVPGVLHKVVKGDTLKSIAQKYKGDVDDIASFNGIDSDTILTIGNEIIIPDGEMTVQSSSSITRTKKGERVYGTNAPSYGGYYIRPIGGGRKSQGLHGYNGIDLAAPTGTPIMASAAGTVISVRGGWGGGYGNHVILAHDNGTKTLYAHNSKNLVSVGQHVAQGEVIALLGSTGKSTGPHVHFEIRGAKNPF
ncbi:MAG: Peptidase M23 family protein [Candidatus Nomurabacteria bacterium GW2011_GWB1_37_5]|uniref:Peptidase M23 family protein n=1 Tax=Candidatus Nomurabacteria bacterium GW2011_GWB1_37_5 TaxID=1618742 RepID=A0A0G0GXJ4_9BACT|nr:MAG: Peptidase M23 family protein [Candidatus Nomurabacteria bacterium GW2011_GWB1_37_5]